MPVSVRNLVAARRGQDRQRIRDCVERAIEHGDLIPTSDAAALAAAIHGFLLGISTQLRDGVGGSELHDAADALLRSWDALATAT